jgi:hypothetical protein
VLCRPPPNIGGFFKVTKNLISSVHAVWRSIKSQAIAHWLWKSFSRTHLLRILRECHSHSPAEARSEAPPTRRLDQARKFWTTPLVHSSLDFVKPTSCPARHRNLLPSSNMKMKNERRGGGIEIAPAGCLQSSQPRVVATGYLNCL